MNANSMCLKVLQRHNVSQERAVLSIVHLIMQGVVPRHLNQLNIPRSATMNLFVIG